MKWIVDGLEYATMTEAAEVIFFDLDEDDDTEENREEIIDELKGLVIGDDVWIGNCNVTVCSDSDEDEDDGFVGSNNALCGFMGFMALDYFINGNDSFVGDFFGLGDD